MTIIVKTIAFVWILTKEMEGIGAPVKMVMKAIPIFLPVVMVSISFYQVEVKMKMKMKFRLLAREVKGKH